ncbi:MAG TPA: nickel pincer cofactor biosynthesis protein LarC [Thermodesulfovibrionales bacterium]|nr:nickel pincer cofactor biosynthesis protein LarC [Thermodesulfovibrionales bacterium]
MGCSKVKIAYIDCFSGISGDMFLGALIDAGVPLDYIENELKKLRLKGYTLREKKVLRAGLAATRVDVSVRAKGEGQKARGWREIRKIIHGAKLPEGIKKQGYAVFKNLFEAEAKVHGETINRVHLHELGSIDCLVDIFGTLIGMSFLGIETVYASPVNVGSGNTLTSHGTFPVPAPATAQILRGVPCHAKGPTFELTTPTGAVLVRTLASAFGAIPHFIPGAIGLGAGEADPDGWPNVLRIMVGEAYGDVTEEAVTVMETNIDDMNPQVYEYVMEKLFDRGALDVFLTPVIMKKSRPGVLLSVLCRADRKNELMDIIFRETTTIGVRFHDAGRVSMRREIKEVRTRYGKARIKISSFGGGGCRCMPEYDDCKRLAAESKVPLTDVMKEAAAAALLTKDAVKKKSGGR